MCLNNVKEIKISTREIVMFKPLMSKKNKYLSPYMGQEYEEGKEYTACERKGKLIHLRIINTSYKSIGTISDIHHGIHGYKRKKQLIESEKMMMRPATHIGKFIIPKGTEYATGEFNGADSYVALKAKCVNISERK